MLLRLLSTRFALWFERTVLWRYTGWRVAPLLLRLAGGSVRRGLPTAVLETTDPRNGRAHRRALVYFHDGERVTVVASKAGLPGEPFWCQNARANPEVSFGGHAFRAEVVDDEPSLTRLWDLAGRFFPSYIAYREHAARAGRTIPILQLVPRSPDE